MRTARPRVVRLRSGQRRRVIWSTLTVVAGSIPSATKAAPLDHLADLEAAGVGVVGATVLRTHVALELHAATTDTSPGVDWGLLQWNKLRASAADMPDPNTNFHADWAMLRELRPGLARSVFTVNSQIFFGSEYDVKARRRLHEMDDTFFFQISNVGTASIVYDLFSRCLVALP